MEIQLYEIEMLIFNQPLMILRDPNIQMRKQFHLDVDEQLQQ